MSEQSKRSHAPDVLISALFRADIHHVFIVASIAVSLFASSKLPGVLQFVRVGLVTTGQRNKKTHPLVLIGLTN
jgi:hypothetical protein